MARTTHKATPVHLWIVGVLALLWNGFGAYDYFMTRTQGADYIDTMMPGVDAGAVMAYINAFPIWASIGWGLGVWGGLAGAILLLMRRRLAGEAFGLSLLGAIVGIGYQLANPPNIPAMQEGAAGVMPYVIVIVALFEYIYTRALRSKRLLH